MITILADRNIPYLEHYLGEGVNLITFNPDKGLPPNKAADALLVRTVTPVNKKTLSPILLRHLQFVATASVGTDHLDIPYLHTRGVRTASAAGCNARAVAEYVGTGLFHWAAAQSLPLLELTVGIVGAGNTGSAVDQLLQSAGISTVVHDPPKARRDTSFQSATVEDILSCDVITFHVPLIHEGADSTHHWLKLEHLEENTIRLVINASRGGVVDEFALKMAYSSGALDDYILDVWEGEPLPVSAVLQDAWLASPHIAGYSVQAKHKATSMITEQLYQHFGIEHKVSEKPALSKSEYAAAQIVQSYLNEIGGTKVKELPESMHEILENIHPAFHLSNELKKSAAYYDEDLINLFRELRTGYPLRNEYAYYTYPDRLLKKYPEINALLTS